MPIKTRAALSKMTKDKLIEEFQELQEERKAAVVCPPAFVAETAAKRAHQVRDGEEGPREPERAHLISQKLNDAAGQNTRLMTEIVDLRAALDKARSEVTAVATKAFEATSGRAALAAVMESNAAPIQMTGKRQAA